MHMSHERKDPNHRILRGLLQSAPGTSFTFVVDGIQLHTVEGQLSLLLCQPFCGQWEIRKDEVSDGCNDESNGTLKDEQPLPTRESSDIIHTMEDTGGNETCERGGEDVTRIQNSDSSGDFFTSVEDTEDVNCTRVKWRFSETQEESRK